jgi:hypothetical protein
VIEDLIARGAQIHVADAGQTLMGFVCFEVKDDEAVTHYIYTKDPFIRTSVEDRLLDSVPGRKPGRFTFHNVRLQRAGWRHCPEMARRKSL